MWMLHALSEHLEREFESSAAFWMARGEKRGGKRNGRVGGKQMALSEEVSIIAMADPWDFNQMIQIQIQNHNL